MGKTYRYNDDNFSGRGRDFRKAKKRLKKENKGRRQERQRELDIDRLAEDTDGQDLHNRW